MRGHQTAQRYSPPRHTKTETEAEAEAEAHFSFSFSSEQQGGSACLLLHCFDHFCEDVENGHSRIPIACCDEQRTHTNKQILRKAGRWVGGGERMRERVCTCDWNMFVCHGINGMKTTNKAKDRQADRQADRQTHTQAHAQAQTQTQTQTQAQTQTQTQTQAQTWTHLRP